MKYSKYRCSAVVLHGEIYVMGKIQCSASLLIKWPISMHVSSVLVVVIMLLHDPALIS